MMSDEWWRGIFADRDKSIVDAMKDGPPNTNHSPLTIHHRGLYVATRKKKNLVIVESPAKAKTINKYLGPDYEVVASKGHVRDLPKSRFGIDIEKGWVPTYRPLQDRKDVLTGLKKQAAKADLVYLAPDPDREGEAIAWHLKEALGLMDERIRRVTFNEIT